jgi:predicted SprT family Zn-dependent metalloprotease
MTTDFAHPVDGALQQVAELGALWGVPHLADRVTITFSRRLTSSLGHCMPREGRLTIADRLRDGPADLLAEVVAHEAAHAAAFLLHGPRRRPHGPEWKALMVRAGFPPRRLLDVPDTLRPPPRRRRYVWEHYCPVCAAHRTAGRPVHQWRCVRCHESGRSGRLRITRLEVHG